ncbi:MAG: PSD1 and planctomycete cytochrome C domain-containing protein [Planctomycetaceae bacterium]
MDKCWRPTSGLLLLAAALSLTASTGRLRADEPIDFNRDIRPILSNTCFKCHGPDDKKRQANMRLDTTDAAAGKLESGETLIVPGDSAKSELYRRISSTDDATRMPPADSGKTLTPAKIELLKKWIDGGGQLRPHWSLITPKRSPPPEVKAAAPTAIDRFVVARLEKEGLQLSPAADKTALIRRVTLDLTGLPPTLAEIDAFLADNSPDAYERLVTRLLGSPHYGEQMTRYWLDAARYGDTHGMHLDNERSLWPYRDWVITAFNDNKPFDQFTIEQLAGDLLPNPTLEQRVATGFNRCNVTTGEGGAIDEEFRVRYAVDRVETTSAVFLGLTLGCAVCHDHKFDPVTQKEFYQLFAYFNSVADKGLDGNALLPPPTLPLSTPEQAAQRGTLEQQVAGVEQAIAAEVAKVTLPETASTAGSASQSLLAWAQAERQVTKSTLPKHLQEIIKLDADKRNAEQQQQLRNYFIEHVYAETRPVFDPLHKQLADAKQKLTDLDKLIPSTLIMQEMETPRPAHVLVRGAYDKPGDPVVPGVPRVIPPELGVEAPKNRLALAKWLVHPQHPLTARVTVNRFWQRYFGTGLVKTAEDFGAQGEWPSHPELLDWLAVEFIESGWNVKHMQKLIVMSSTYRQSSRVTPELLKVDRENRLLTRGPRFRMDAEMIRDNALAISGLLVSKIGGRSVKPYQPPGLWEAIAYPTSTTAKFVKDEGEGLYRRSLYTFWKRTSPPPSMTNFDAPSRESCTVNRSRTNTPLQALNLMNDEQFVEAARRFAERVMTEGGATERDRAVFAFRLATARMPNDGESSVLLAVWKSHLEEYQGNAEAARKLIDVGDSTPNPALNASELAAWTMVANLLLNLDEAVTKG